MEAWSQPGAVLPPREHWRCLQTSLDTFWSQLRKGACRGQACYETPSNAQDNPSSNELFSPKHQQNWGTETLLGKKVIISQTVKKWGENDCPSSCPVILCPPFWLAEPSRMPETSDPSGAIHETSLLEHWLWMPICSVRQEGRGTRLSL